MNMPDKTWNITVDLEAQIKVRLKVENGKVKDFAVTLVYIPNGTGEPENVILYDSAHGEIDCHRYWKESDIKETKRFENRSKKEVFRQVYDELKAHWQHYLDLYKKHRK